MPKRPWTPVRRALRHRASFWQPLQPWFVKETAFFFAKAQNLRIWRSRILGQYAGILWRDLVLAFGKASQTLLFAK